MDLKKRYLDSCEVECNIMQMILREPQWAANRIQAGEIALKQNTELEKKELEKCELLCANCHRLVHNNYKKGKNEDYIRRSLPKRPN